MLAPAQPRVTIAEFHRAYAGQRVELVGGRVFAMAGGSLRHADVAGNIYAALRSKLAGSPCRPFNSDMAVLTSEDTIRYPDVPITCDERDLTPDPSDVYELRFPKVLIEVRSPSTDKEDRLVKVEEYKAMPSVAEIVLVHPTLQRFATYKCVGASEWLNSLHPPGASLVLRNPAVVLTPGDIFGEN